MTCLPTGAVEWLLGHFEIHSKLVDEKVIVTTDGKRLDEKKKAQFIDFFNQAIFMEKYYIWPGTEQKYLSPEKGGTPIVIETKRGKMDVKLLVFIYDNHIDVVKQYKKKVIAYSLHSDTLQKRSIINNKEFISSIS